MVFEVSVIQEPTVLEAQAGGQTKIIAPFEMVAAKDSNSASLIVGAQLADKLPTDRGDNLKVIIRQVS